jgi:hypothetical protein
MDKEDDQGEEDEGADRWDADAIGSLSIGAKISLKVNHFPVFTHTELMVN